MSAGWPVVLELLLQWQEEAWRSTCPARVARARLRAVIAEDRAKAGEGRWLPSVPKVRIERVDMGWTPGAVYGTRVWLKNAFRWEPRR